MTELQQIYDGFLRWIDAIALTLVAMAGWFSSRRTVQFVEEERGAFVLKGGPASSRLLADPVHIVDGQLAETLPEKTAALLHGSRGELVLRPDRFLFRPLPLPKRAGEFLDGIVRSQIDRLTPWNANEAVFGWAKPVEDSTDRMVVTVAATARTFVAPYLQALTRLGIKSIAVSTLLPGPIRFR